LNFTYDWANASNSHPDTDRPVLVAYKNGKRCIARYGGDKQWHIVWPPSISVSGLSSRVWLWQDWPRTMKSSGKMAPHELAPSQTKLLAKAGVVIAAKGPRFCKDCIWHHGEFDSDKGRARHECRNDQLRNLVTGFASDPMANRRNETLCGKAGAYFSAKPAKKA